MRFPRMPSARIEGPSVRAGASIALIREHGYRFPSIEAAIDAIEPEEDVVVPECERIWVDQLLDDLAYAIHRCRNSRRRDRLSEV